jgi:threonine synthase
MVSYISTRGKSGEKSFTEVLLSGMAPDGGLFIPKVWPKLDMEELANLSGTAYTDIAYHVISKFTGEDIEAKTLKKLITETFEQNFAHSAVAPLVQIGPSGWIMELFHGPTLAFKDYPLQLLGKLFDHVLEQRGERVTIVGATSGDTGSAAIEACKSCKNIDIFILHPKGRTSEVQRRQMTTIIAPNVYNIALEGTFDDCQRLVKEMFADDNFRNEMNLSAVNSINWARIMSQIVYYVTASLALGGAFKDEQGKVSGRKVTFAVPTGNFGNVFAAWSAKQMGLPIENLVIGSNRNDILTRFFETGKMKLEGVEPSLSPSMDIQVSSNFERYLCEALGRDHEKLSEMMEQFKATGEFTVPEDVIQKIKSEFSSGRCTDEQTSTMISECYKQTGYLLDPHTAVGLFCGWQEHNNNPQIPLVSLACAHPAKFPDAVEKATGTRPPLPPHLADLYEREEKLSVLENDLTKVQTFIKSSLDR